MRGTGYGVLGDRDGQSAWGMGQSAWSIGQSAWGMEYGGQGRAIGIGLSVF